MCKTVKGRGTTSPAPCSLQQAHIPSGAQPLSLQWCCVRSTHFLVLHTRATQAGQCEVKAAQRGRASCMAGNPRVEALADWLYWLRQRCLSPPPNTPSPSTGSSHVGLRPLPRLGMLYPSPPLSVSSRAQFRDLQVLKGLLHSDYLLNIQVLVLMAGI